MRRLLVADSEILSESPFTHRKHVSETPRGGGGKPGIPGPSRIFSPNQKSWVSHGWAIFRQSRLAVTRLAAQLEPKARQPCSRLCSLFRDG